MIDIAVPMSIDDGAKCPYVISLCYVGRSSLRIRLRARPLGSAGLSPPAADPSPGLLPRPAGSALPETGRVVPPFFSTCVPGKYGVASVICTHVFVHMRSHERMQPCMHAWGA